MIVIGEGCQWICYRSEMQMYLAVDEMAGVMLQKINKPRQKLMHDIA